MAQSIKILIVDDLELVHEPIERFLRSFVFTESQLAITSAYNLTQAKRILTEGTYDLVMLDGDVGGDWGYEIIDTILEHNNNVIIISSSNHDNFNTTCVSMGVHEAVNKTYLYDWNDRESTFRIEKAKVIRELFERRSGKH